MRWEHELDRQLEERTQHLEDLLGRDTLVRPLDRKLQALPAVDEPG
jgi:hypothetical protein